MSNTERTRCPLALRTMSRKGSQALEGSRESRDASMMGSNTQSLRLSKSQASLYHSSSSLPTITRTRRTAMGLQHESQKDSYEHTTEIMDQKDLTHTRRLKKDMSTSSLMMYKVALDRNPNKFVLNVSTRGNYSLQDGKLMKEAGLRRMTRSCTMNDLLATSPIAREKKEQSSLAINLSPINDTIAIGGIDLYVIRQHRLMRYIPPQTDLIIAGTSNVRAAAHQLFYSPSNSCFEEDQYFHHSDGLKPLDITVVPHGSNESCFLEPSMQTTEAVHNITHQHQATDSDERIQFFAMRIWSYNTRDLLKEDGHKKQELKPNEHVTNLSVSVNSTKLIKLRVATGNGCLIGTDINNSCWVCFDKEEEAACISYPIIERPKTMLSKSLHSERHEADLYVHYHESWGIAGMNSITYSETGTKSYGLWANAKLLNIQTNVTQTDSKHSLNFADVNKRFIAEHRDFKEALEVMTHKQLRTVLLAGTVTVQERILIRFISIWGWCNMAEYNRLAFERIVFVDGEGCVIHPKEIISHGCDDPLPLMSGTTWSTPFPRNPYIQAVALEFVFERPFAISAVVFINAKPTDELSAFGVRELFIHIDGLALTSDPFEALPCCHDESTYCTLIVLGPRFRNYRADEDKINRYSLIALDPIMRPLKEENRGCVSYTLHNEYLFPSLVFGQKLSIFFYGCRSATPSDVEDVKEVLSSHLAYLEIFDSNGPVSGHHNIVFHPASDRALAGISIITTEPRVYRALYLKNRTTNGFTDFGIFCDDYLVFMGTLQPRPNLQMVPLHQSLAHEENVLMGCPENSVTLKDGEMVIFLGK